jgi:hypothetical protein
LSETTAFCWSVTIVAYWVWMLLLLTVPLGRVPGLALLALSVIGYMLRRGCRLKWVLIILTFEGAFRIGMLLSICGLVWRQL